MAEQDRNANRIVAVRLEHTEEQLAQLTEVNSHAARDLRSEQQQMKRFGQEVRHEHETEKERVKELNRALAHSGGL